MQQPEINQLQDDSVSKEMCREFIAKQLKRGIHVTMMLFIAFGLTSCGATTLSSMLMVPTVPVPSGGLFIQTVPEDSVLSLKTFNDVRGETKIAVHRAKAIEPMSKVSIVVDEALQTAFKRKGFSLSATAPLAVAGEVREWVAEVGGPELRGGALGKAVLYLQIFDPSNKKIYSGTYQGTVELAKSSIKDKDVQQVLAESMSEAIAQIFSDQKLIDVLTSF